MSWREAIVQIVTKINPALPASDLTDDAHLTDLGIRSLQLVELVEHIERRVGHRVRLEELLMADSGQGMLEVGRLVSWLDEQVPIVSGGRK